MRKPPRRAKVMYTVTACGALLCARGIRAQTSRQSLEGAAALNAAPPTPTPIPDPRLARFAGTYRFVGGDRERGGIERAIDRSVAILGPEAGPIARVREHARTPTYAWVTIRLPPYEIEITRPGERPLRTRDCLQETTTEEPYDNPLHVTQGYDCGRSGGLVQHIWDRSHDIRHTYSLSDDGGTLTDVVDLSIPASPIPVHYTLTFRR